MSAVLAAEPLAEPDYAAVVDAQTVAPVDEVRGDLRLLVAARLGKPRLLDNLGVTAPRRPCRQHVVDREIARRDL